MAHHWTYLYIQQNNTIQINSENTNCYTIYSKSLIHSIHTHKITESKHHTYQYYLMFSYIIVMVFIFNLIM